VLVLAVELRGRFANRNRCAKHDASFAQS
jgi:hypothetical protein